MKIKYFGTKNNIGFPPEITTLIRFVRPAKAIKCAACDKKSKKLWTMLVPFKAQITQQFSVLPSDELKALVAVCDDHPLLPMFIELAELLDQQKGVVLSDD